MQGDSRFDDARDKLPKFFVFWTLQAVWVFITLSPVAVLNGTEHDEGATRVCLLGAHRPYFQLQLCHFSKLSGLWASDIIGGAIWVTGYFCEATADFQKLAFKADPANKGKFIDKGARLPWCCCRTPLGWSTDHCHARRSLGIR